MIPSIVVLGLLSALALVIGLAIAALTGALAAFCAIGLFGIYLDVRDVQPHAR